jgi:hypothetical protein
MAEAAHMQPGARLLAGKCLLCEMRLAQIGEHRLKP